MVFLYTARWICIRVGNKNSGAKKTIIPIFLPEFSVYICLAKSLLMLCIKGGFAFCRSLTFANDVDIMNKTVNRKCGYEYGREKDISI